MGEIRFGENTRMVIGIIVMVPPENLTKVMDYESEKHDIIRI